MTEIPALSVVTTTDPVARQLPLLLEALSSLAVHEHKRYEIIIVDDLGQWKTEKPPACDAMDGLTIKTVQPYQRQGQLKAIQQGLAQATSPLILTIDPDLYACVPEIPDMVAMIDDMTLAIHAVRGEREDVGLFRQIASDIVNSFIRTITGLEVKDIGSPITLFKRDVLDMLPPISSGKQPNLRLRAYLILDDRLACYNLKAGATSSASSHYNLVHLIGTTWRLLRDAINIRLRHTMRSP